MKKQLAIATVAIMLMAVLLAPSVLASALRDDMTIDVDGKQLNLIGIENIDKEDITGGNGSIDIQRYISGYVGPGQWIGYGYLFSQGVQVRIEITHSPSNADVVLGVMDDEFNLIDYIVDTDHNGHAEYPSDFPFDCTQYQSTVLTI